MPREISFSLTGSDMFHTALAMLVAALVFLIFILFPLTAEAQSFSDPGFVAETVVSLPPYTPIGLTWAPDGRMFIWQKSGVVKVFKNGALLSTPFLDIHTKVNQCGDRGLLGLTFDPDFTNNGYVYLYYVYENTSNTSDCGAKTLRLTRVTADPANPDAALPGSEVVLIGSIGVPPCSNYPASADCIANDSTSHSGGTIRFAPDGMLFVSIGDGASYGSADIKALRCQDLDNYSGKLLRLNPVDGSAPGGNPFDDGSNSIRSRIWSYGLRNPFRFGLDPVFGEPYIGNVGWNTWEAIYTGRGANFGWPCYEGPSPQPSYQAEFAQCRELDPASVTPPFYAYDRSQGYATMGGSFYTGTVYPSQYQGNFFFMDLSGWIKRMVLDADRHILSIQPFASGIAEPVGLEMGPDGSLYYIEFDTGNIDRIVFSGPVAKASATPTFGYSPLSVDFSSAGSIDSGGGTLSYSWDFGDGATSTAANPAHTYVAGTVTTFTATLTVKNAQNLSATAKVTITVGSRPPLASISAPADGTYVNAGETITYQGSASDPDEGDLPSGSLQWTVLLYHNTHAHPYLTGTGFQGSFVVEELGGAGDFAFQIILTATDSSGLTDTKSILLHVNPPPSISITSPLNNTAYSAPANIRVTAEATAGIGTVSRVDFYSGITHIGAATASPYSIDWNNVPAGAYILTAQVTDSQGGTVTSSPVAVTVLNLAHYDFNYADRTALIGAGWNFLAVTPAGGTRNTEQTTGAVVSYDQGAHPGILRIPCDAGDLWASQNNTRNTLFRGLPSNWTGIRLKLSFSPSQNYQQAGLAAYQDDNNYVEITRKYENGNNITLSRENNGSPANLFLPTVTATNNLHLRLDRNPATENIEAYYSLDGNAWTFVGSVTKALVNPRLAIVVGASPGGFPNADLAWAEVITATPTPPALVLNQSSLNFAATEGTNPVNQTISLSNSGEGTLNWTATTDTTPPAWLSVSPGSGTGNATLLVAVNTAGLNPGTYTGTITVSDPGAVNSPQTVNVTLSINAPSTLVFATNSGGGQHTDIDGVTYQADTGFSGGFKASTSAAIAGTTDDTLYQSERYGNFSYNIPLANGDYTVTLKFAEIYWDVSGRRVFNVSMQGTQVISNLDIFSKAGKNAAYDITKTVSVTNGMLNINFTSVSDNAKVSAILITNAQSTSSPAIGLSSSTFNFSATTGTNPANQTLSLTNTGGGTLNWTAAANTTAPAWLTVSPGSGTGNTQLTLSINTSGLSQGTYTKTITVSSPDAVNTPQTVNVSLTVNPVSSNVFISDLSWVGTPTNGWGPVEKDMSNGESAAGDGKTITLNTVTYSKGLGVHANSIVTYNLGGNYSRFVSDIGLDDEVGSAGSVVFQVLADNLTLFDSGIMTGASATQHVDLDMTGITQLQLKVNSGSTLNSDHADWAGAYLVSATAAGPQIGLSPSSLTFSSVEGANPASRTINLTNTGSGTLNWSATADATAPAWLSVNPPSGSGNAALTVSVNTSGLVPGTYTKAITVSDPAAVNTPQTLNVTLTVNQASNVVFAINSGGTQYTDLSGVLYQTDTKFTGGSKASTASAIGGTSDDTLYQSERYGNFSYNIPLANGNYTVTFKFAEIYWTAAGQRKFNVSMQGTQVISNLDIFSKVGKNAAYDVTIPVSVTNGTLNINFTSIADWAKISAIVITSQ